MLTFIRKMKAIVNDDNPRTREIFAIIVVMIVVFIVVFVVLVALLVNFPLTIPISLVALLIWALYVVSRKKI